MAINLEFEAKCEFTAQEVYDIIDAAVIDSYDNGFMNSFVFQRALIAYTFAAFCVPDEIERKTLFIQIHENPLLYWDETVVDNVAEVLEAHQDTFNYIAEEAATWFDEYTEYAYSTRGMLDNLGDIMQGVTTQAEDQLLAMQRNGELQGVMEVADKWGMNNEQPSLFAVQDLPEVEAVVKE